LCIILSVADDFCCRRDIFVQGYFYLYTISKPQILKAGSRQQQTAKEQYACQNGPVCPVIFAVMFFVSLDRHFSVCPGV